MKRIYGVLERQFRLYFKEADRRKGITGENLLVMLERRLDNVAYSLGFAASRAQARQLVRHGHIQVDGKKTTIPSYQVKPGQAVAVREGSRKNELIRASVDTARGRGVPDWMELDAENFGIDEAPMTYKGAMTRDAGANVDLQHARNPTGRPALHAAAARES